MLRLFTAAAFGLIAGILLKKSVVHSLWQRAGEEPAWIFWLPFINGLLYAGITALTGWRVESLLYCLCASFLLAVGIVDQRTLEIPWEYNLLIGGLGVLRMVIHLSRWREFFWGFFAVGSLLLFFFLITGGKGIGGGDVKLMAAAGLFLGWEKALLAFLLGGIVGIVSHVIARKKAGKTRIFALGPYLAAGIFCVIFL